MPNRKYTTRNQILKELPSNLPGDIYKRTTLSGTLAIDGTVVTVASLSGFPPIGDLLIDNELVEYLATTGSQATTLTRGAWNTTATAHADGVPVYNAYLDRLAEKMTGYIDTVLTQRYQTFPDYTPTGSCPEVVEWIARNLAAHEARIDMGIKRNVGEGQIEDVRYDRALKMLEDLAAGRKDIPLVDGTTTLAFGTDRDAGTLPLGQHEAFINHKAIIPETVQVTNAGTTYVQNEDYAIGWDEDRQKWLLWRAQDDKITDNATATYQYTWMRSWRGKSPADRLKARTTNTGLLIRGA